MGHRPSCNRHSYASRWVGAERLELACVRFDGVAFCSLMTRARARVLDGGCRGNAARNEIRHARLQSDGQTPVKGVLVSEAGQLQVGAPEIGACAIHEFVVGVKQTVRDHERESGMAAQRPIHCLGDGLLGRSMGTRRKRNILAVDDMQRAGRLRSPRGNFISPFTPSITRLPAALTGGAPDDTTIRKTGWRTYCSLSVARFRAPIARDEHARPPIRKGHCHALAACQFDHTCAVTAHPHFVTHLPGPGLPGGRLPISRISRRRRKWR
jgi:hypothetical protein